MTKDKLEDLQQLEEKIENLRQRENNLNGARSESEMERASRIGLRIGTELLSAVLVGAAIGYVADKFFNTSPWCMVVFLLFGGAAGVLNVYRLAQKEDNRK